MNKYLINIKINEISLEELKTFYINNDETFNPKLSEQVESVSAYIEKIKKNAEIIVAYNENEVLVGIVAIYLNDQKGENAFITSVVVDKMFQGKGIANELLKKVILLVKEKKFLKINLEVFKNNFRAIKLYEKFGFSKDLETNYKMNMIKMKLELN